MVSDGMFRRALPVWQFDKTIEKNYSLLFTTRLGPRAHALLRIAGHTCFWIRVNGQPLAFGPARAPHGFYRVEEHPLDGLLNENINVVTIIVAGYNVNSYAYVEGLPFLCCEIVDGMETLAATGCRGLEFDAVPYSQRVQKVQRYSFQRPFVECYRLGPDYDDAATCPTWREVSYALAPVNPGRFIRRTVPYPTYEWAPAVQTLERGHITGEILDAAAAKSHHDAPVPGLASDKKGNAPAADRAIAGIGETLQGFPVEELEELTVETAAACRPDHAERCCLPGTDADLDAGGYITCRLPKNLTGFVELTAVAEEDLTLVLTFDEVLGEEGINFFRMSCSNVIVWHLKGGCSYQLRSFEPYTMQYMSLFALGGAVQLRGLGLRRYDFPPLLLMKKRDMPTPQLQTIYDAAVESFRQNTLDIFMDCPSRERAGWLCDSFFTARVEKALTGRNLVERTFLENFLLPPVFYDIPEGMLPMCYPADHNDHNFIPNWAMWFVLELEEYLQRTRDNILVAVAKERVYALLDYFAQFENADGLLEKLDGWVFVEWSRSNQLVQDINYPTNMLYARMKEAVAALYGDQKAAKEAAALKETIRRQAYMGNFFCDNAVYGPDGKAHLSKEATECCQYYAFFTGVADPKRYPALWHTLVHDFGPARKQHNKYPQVAFANAFIGNYLRLEMLYNAGLHDQVLQEIEGYFLYMAEKTGTLWENDGDYASCDHGFASHVIYWLHGIFGGKK